MSGTSGNIDEHQERPQAAEASAGLEATRPASSSTIYTVADAVGRRQAC